MIRFSAAAAVILGAAWFMFGDAGQVSAQDKTIEKVMSAIPEKAPAAPKQTRKVLIYSRTKGFRHGSIGIGTKAIAMMGDKTGASTPRSSPRTRPSSHRRSSRRSMPCTCSTLPAIASPPT